MALRDVSWVIRSTNGDTFNGFLYVKSSVPHQSEQLKFRVTSNVFSGFLEAERTYFVVPDIYDSQRNPHSANGNTFMNYVPSGTNTLFMEPISAYKHIVSFDPWFPVTYKNTIEGNLYG